MSAPRTLSWLIGLVIMVWAVAAGAATVDGVLTVVWGDGVPDGGGSRTRFRVTAADGHIVGLAGDGVAGVVPGGLYALVGRRVRVWFDGASTVAFDRVVPLAIASLEDASDRSVTGSKPWVSLLCRFADVASEPAPLSYFENMFGTAAGELDHFWREVSYDAIDIVGSDAYGWAALPNNQTHYVPVPGAGCLDGNPDNDADLDALFADCVAALDGVVDFANGGQPFEGINLMFNSDLDGCAWGGSMWAVLDGVDKLWRTTWEPPWGWDNVCVMAHEMGHGFGLPHSNNWDGDGSPYDNTWDVMSDAWQYAGWDPVYGTIGKHTIAYHKDLLGWIPPAQRVTVPLDTIATVTLDWLELAVPAHSRMTVIPLAAGGSFYTLEARARYGHYDSSLPGDAVIIHHVDPGRQEPAWAYDAAVPPGNYADGEGVMWRVGETFTDAANQVEVTIDAVTATGFVVTVARGGAATIFHDSYESGGFAEWSGAVP